MPKNIKFKSTSNIKKTSIKWVVMIIIWTFILSILMNTFSSGLMSVVNIAGASMILLLLVIIGILFDIIGTAVAASDETPFHSMASRRVRASKQAIKLIRNAEKVANFCNDVIGDISSIVSGSAAALIVSSVAVRYNMDSIIMSLVITALVASVTVGGKALGKTFAIRNANMIVYYVAYIISVFQGKTKREEK